MFDIIAPYTGLKVATSYGRHALRPSAIINFDNPMSPSLFESLVSVSGAKNVEWDKRLDCCGNPLWGKNNSLSLDLMRKKYQVPKRLELNAYARHVPIVK